MQEATMQHLGLWVSIGAGGLSIISGLFKFVFLVGKWVMAREEDSERIDRLEEHSFGEAFRPKNHLPRNPQ